MDINPDDIWIKTDKCGQVFKVHVHDKGCGARVPVRFTCDLIWCEDCREIWAKIAFKKFLEVLSKYKWPGHVVLTIKNTTRLSEGFEQLRVAFKRIKQRKIWGSVKHYMARRGLTYNQERGDWHCHLHLGVDCEWLEFEELKETWRKVTKGLGVNVWIGRCKINGSGKPDIARLAGELAEGTKGDIENLVKHAKQDFDMSKELFTWFKNRKIYWFSRYCRPDREKKPIIVCPKCGDIYDFREWTRYDYTEDELNYERISGLMWADFYDGFEYIKRE